MLTVTGCLFTVGWVLAALAVPAGAARASAVSGNTAAPVRREMGLLGVIVRSMLAAGAGVVVGRKATLSATTLVAQGWSATPRARARLHRGP